jgi:hypothetical protein
LDVAPVVFDSVGSASSSSEKLPNDALVKLKS